VERGPIPGIRFVAGLDVAYARGRALGAAASVDIDGPRVVERAVAHLEERVPYILGYLAEREVGPMISALKRLDRIPDAVMVNGHGIAHPRGFGLASSLALFSIPSTSLGPWEFAQFLTVCPVTPNASALSSTIPSSAPPPGGPWPPGEHSSL
jgi:hypothetical protein